MANEKRSIDANALWADIMMLPHNGDMISSEEVEQAIKEAPTVDAVEVVHGRWITQSRQSARKSQGDILYTVIKNSCSECYHESDSCWNYCPNCGAKMDGDRNGSAQV